MSDVFDYLSEVRGRPGMFIHSLRDLENQLLGYYSALGLHGIIEPLPSMGAHFLNWMYYKTG